jgi:phosphoserine phosphatase
MDIIFNLPKEKVLEKLRRADVVCTDLDECLFPFFTQVLVAGEILVESLFKRNKWKYIPQLVGGALLIICLLIVTFGNIRRLSNGFLMRRFARSMRGIPLELIRKHSRYIHTFFYTESLHFLQLLAQKNIPIIILSLSIQPILEELKSNIGFITHVIGNRISEDSSGTLFSDYQQPVMKNGSDKLQRFLDYARETGFHRPLIIGHSDDEIPLVRYSRSCGGLSIGINPKKHLAHEFDIVLTSVNWSPLTGLIREL